MELTKNQAKLPAYAPAPAEQKALAARAKRLQSRVPAPSIKVTDTKAESGAITREFSWDHANQRAAFDLFHASINSVGTEAFMRGLLLQLAEATANSQSLSPERDQEAVNFCLPILQGIKPNDEIETLLAIQMAITHWAFIRMATKHARTTNPLSEQMYEKQVNRFARTFAAQMQSLKVYRAKGKQSIVVKHVTVSHGGQAIIGNVKRGARGAQKKLEATS
jgi:hypothetical protein